ncbi:endonuclease/exonuclease/phosphatase family protein [Acuticoccus sp. M5D2P5]|uniref:endonuclease/exonuclease/phosphatase family protein n=1 Tax=Acuticoccus kalidii TaxID=2910977 RepID=UPI001F42C84F|nr:endonuclease/exonuclease/phosphatase family protein [Acuticoccus kalidii]MCF3935561.1 endonuclease/exonuclease/phosphatase family protein [Acuticoccus kalidii]
MRVRVATYNIRKCVGLDWRRQPDRILRVINELDADIVALQEADRRFGQRITTLSHTTLMEEGWRPASVAMHEGGLGWHGNAILLSARVQIEDTHRTDLPAYEPRGAVLVDARIDGQPVRIVGTHLGLTPDRRTAQARFIAEMLSSRPARPTIFMGDLNEWRAQAGCIAILSKSLVFANPAPTYHASRPVAAFDRIAASPDIAFLDHGVHRSQTARRASDHLPLWADIVLPSAD